MSLARVGIVYRKELVDSLRDRRTLISMVVVPVLLMPVLMLGMGSLAAKTVKKASQEVAKVMILGGQDSPQVLAGLKEVRMIEIVPPAENYREQISDKKIRAAVEIPPGFADALKQGGPAKIQIYKYEGDIKSGFGAQQLDQFFRNLRDATVRERLLARNLPEALLKPFEVTQQNVASPEKVGGSMFGGIIPYMIILMCFMGAMYPAIDLTAGEKERGTIETLLCSPVARTDLVLGKFLMVFSASLASAALSIASMTVTFHIGKKLIARQGPQAAAMTSSLSIDPQGVLAVFFMILPLAVLFSSALLAIALLARTYKEAQSYISPLTMVIILPAVVSMLPGTELNFKLALIPVLSTSLVSKEIISGSYPWGMIGLSFASSCVYAAGMLAITAKLFNREEVLFRT